MRVGSAFFVMLLVFALAADFHNPSASSGFAMAASKKKAAGAKKGPKQYNEVVELMADIGYNLCMALGKLIKGRKNFNAKRRCDLFQECIEDLGGMTDAMVKELDMTQQDMVNNAQKFPHFAQLQMNLKKSAKTILAKKQPSEKVVSDELNKDMSQWILNVAVGQNGHSSGLDKLPRESLKNMRNMGIKLPSYGILDDDELEDEEYLLDEGDKAWANQRDLSADDDDDADEEDDEA